MTDKTNPPPGGVSNPYARQYDRYVECPWCNSQETHVVSPFGGTVSEILMKCDNCKNTFGWMKWEHRKRQE